jgi:DNA-binding PadR family transcriptional regulator
MLRYILLGFIARRPMSGYDIIKLFDTNLSRIWPALSSKRSQIYPELARLQEQGWITQSEPGPRGRKTYTITEQGLAEVRRWLRETRPARNPINEAFLRVSFLWLLDDDEIEEYVTREEEFHTRQARQLSQVKEQLLASPNAKRRQVQAMTIFLEAAIRFENAMVEWAEWARTQFGEEDEGTP